MTGGATNIILGLFTTIGAATVGVLLGYAIYRFISRVSR